MYVLPTLTLVLPSWYTINIVRTPDGQISAVYPWANGRGHLDYMWVQVDDQPWRLTIKHMPTLTLVLPTFIQNVWLE